MLRKTMSAILSICVIGSCSAFTMGDNNPFQLTVSAKEKTAVDYTYEITPILSPFNEYFYVKTDNPDPLSFRFADNTTVYAENGACGSLDFLYDSWDEEVILFSDVVYEDKSTARVKGGYIFEGKNTDGGNVTLQYKKEISYSEYSKLEQEGSSNIGEITETLSSSSDGGAGFKTYQIIGYYKWENTSLNFKLPKLVSEFDYLVDTYAVKDNFFDNMDAVQAGLDSICLYSGSYVKGEVYRANKYWFLSTSPHVDQDFYIQNPYRRKGNKSLFASYIYPYRWDSYSFPNAMGIIAKILEPSATYKSNENYHWLIDVTFNGETRTFGGAGNGDGVGIKENQIIKKFTFENGAEKIGLEKAKSLLDQYSNIEEIDDYPHYDDLTWEQVLNKVGETGAWVRLVAVYSIFGSSGTGYTYIFKHPEFDSYPSYACDAWVDGRYINRWEFWEEGVKFEDYPTSDIMLTSVTIPQIAFKEMYTYNESTDDWEKEFVDIKVDEQKQKNVLFYYDEDEKLWKASYSAFDYGCADYSEIAEMVEKGLIDKKYLGMVTLTLDEVKALKVDRNTNIIPQKGFIYDGTAEPGTPYEIIPLTNPDVSVALSSSVFTYNGSVQVPKVTVKYKGKLLKEGTDYTQTFSDKSSKTSGKYTVRVEGIGDYSGTVRKTYKIVPAAYSIKLNNTSINLSVGESRSLKATTNPSAASDGVTWTTSDKKVATVSDGTVKAVGKGKATITAKTSNGKTATCTVNVSAPVTGISLSSSKIKMNKGDSATLTADITPKDANNKTVKWSSSDSTVVSVSAGKIIAKEAGTATITAETYNGKKATCVVTVVVPEEEVSLSKNTVYIAKGKSFTLAAKVLPADATDKTLTWKSSNQNVAAVSNGKIVAKSEGTAFITVSTSNGKTASCRIVVKGKKSKLPSGDVNGDGTTDIADALLISRYDAGLITMTSEQIRVADINEDGSADIADALMIARYDAGLIEFLL